MQLLTLLIFWVAGKTMGCTYNSYILHICFLRRQPFSWWQFALKRERSSYPPLLPESPPPSIMFTYPSVHKSQSQTQRSFQQYRTIKCPLISGRKTLLYNTSDSRDSSWMWEISLEQWLVGKPHCDYASFTYCASFLHYFPLFSWKRP